MRRFLAWAGILIVFAAFLALIVMAFSGAPANVLLALLLCLIIVPVLIYALLFGTRMFSPGTRGQKDTDERAKDRD